MFAKLLKIFATRCNIKTNIRSETPRLEGYEMSNEEYKEYIIEMIQKINNPEHLKRTFNYVHKFFIRRTGR